MDPSRKPHATANGDGVVYAYTTNMRYKCTHRNPWESHAIPIRPGETLLEFRKRLLQALKPLFNQDNFCGIWDDASVMMVAIDSNGTLVFNDAEDKVGHYDGCKDPQNLSVCRREHQTLQELGIPSQSHVYAFPGQRSGATRLYLKFPPALPSNQKEAMVVSIQVPNLFAPCMLLKILLVAHQQQQQQLSNDGLSDDDMDIDDDEDDDDGRSKSKVASGLDIDSNSIGRIRLIFAGKQLEDYRRCVDYGLCGDSTIFVLKAS
jgi:hypothetical protein